MIAWALRRYSRGYFTKTVYGYTSTQQTTQRALLNERSVLVYVLGPTRAHRASTGQRFRAIFLHRHASGGREGEVAGGEGGETRAAPAASTVEGGDDEGGGGAAWTAAASRAVSRAAASTISPLQWVVQNKTADPRRRLSAGHETLFDRDFDMVRRV